MGKDKKSTALHWREAEDLEWFTARGHDLVQQSPLGGQLERLRDQVGLVFGLPETTPAWMTAFHRDTESARSRRIALRLIRASEVWPQAGSVLWAYHHPVAVALDGVTFAEKGETKTTNHGRLDVGRLLALYPGTETGSEARRWLGCQEDRKAIHGAERGLRWLCVGRAKPGPARAEPFERIGRVMSRDGKTADDASRLMASVKLSAKGEESREWARIDREARRMLASALAAWKVSTPTEDEFSRETMSAEFSELTDGAV